jgi:hypothetical protein
MGKGIEAFINPEFVEQYRIQELKQYQRHKNFLMDKYGIDIDLLLTDDEPQMYMGDFYNRIESGDLYEAYRMLKARKDIFRTEQQKQLYDAFEKICLNRVEMDAVKPGDWVKDDYNFIYNVLRAENGTFLIKKFFDARTIRSIDYQTDNVSYTEKFELLEKFRIKTSNLNFFQNPTAEEQAKIDAHLAIHPEDIAKIDRFTDKFLEYRQKLLAYGMVSPQNSLGTELEKFYKYTSDQTAFVINIDDYGDYLFVCYGVTTVSLSADYRTSFEEGGADDDTMTVRRCIKIKSEADEVEAEKRIKAFYDEHAGLTKEEILAKSKELRKEFMKVITDKLKPLGFKKKSNHWRKPLENGFYIEFSADKSTYSDSYQFDINLFRENVFPYCYRNVPKYNDDCVIYNVYFNWQLTSREAFARYLDEGVLPAIEHILETPQEKWAQDGELSSHTVFCDKNKCEHCPFKKE